MPGEKGSITPKFLLDLKDTCDTQVPVSVEQVKTSESMRTGVVVLILEMGVKTAGDPVASKLHS